MAFGAEKAFAFDGGLRSQLFSALGKVLRHQNLADSRSLPICRTTFEGLWTELVRPVRCCCYGTGHSYGDFSMATFVTTIKFTDQGERDIQSTTK